MYVSQNIYFFSIQYVLKANILFSIKKIKEGIDYDKSSFASREGTRYFI